MASTQTSDITSSIDKTSKSVLSVQFVANVSFAVAGFPCFICNFLLFFVLLRSKKLRTNFYICLMNGAIADSLFSFFYCIIKLKRVILAMLDMPETTDTFRCVLIFFPVLLFRNNSLAQTSTIAVDRLLCLIMPIRYRNLDSRYLRVVNIFMWVSTTIMMITIGVVYLTPSSVLPNCTMGLIWIPQFTNIYSGMAVVLNVGTIGIYCVLIPFLFIRLHLSKRAELKEDVLVGKDMTSVKDTLQFKAMVTSFLLLGVYTTVVLAAQILLLATNDLDPVTKSKVQPTSATISIVSANLSFAICVWRCQDIREAIRHVVYSKHNNKVYQIPISKVKSSKSAGAACTVRPNAEANATKSTSRLTQRLKTLFLRNDYY